MKGRIWLIFILFAVAMRGRLSAATQIDGNQTAKNEAYAQFATDLEQLRQDLHIPGMAAAIVQDQELVWAEGFGYANVEEKIPATADTPFHLASVTKPIAATLLMQLVEEGVLDLSDPVADYGVFIGNPDVTIWHLLTHTSEGVPGTAHNYDGSRFAALGQVIARASGQSFGQLLAERMLRPLNMEHTAPNPAGWEGFLATLGLQADNRQNPTVYRQLARPYQFDAQYENIPGSYPLHFSPAAGLLASVTDLAQFDIALDNDLLLRPETKEQMFTAARANSGAELIYGLGWYTQQYHDTRLIWHSGGWTPSVSALLLKVPDENLTFIILANNYNLTRPFPLGDGDVLVSTPALLFYERFVFPRVTGKTVPSVDWKANQGEIIAQLNQVTDADMREILERELWSYRKLYASVGEKTQVYKLLAIHRRVFTDFAASRTSLTLAGINDNIPEPIPPSLRPEQVYTFSMFLLGWVALTGVALVALLATLVRNAAMPLSYKLAWVVVTLLFGVFGIAAYWLTDGQGKRPFPQPWRQAIVAVLYSVTGNMVGLTIALLIVINYFPAAPGAPPAVLTMFLTGWLLFRTPLAARNTGQSYWRLLPRMFLVELGSAICVIIGTVPVLTYFLNNLFRSAENSPLFLITILLASGVAAVLVYPYTIWLLRRGIWAWSPYETAGPISTQRRDVRLA